MKEYLVSAYKRFIEDKLKHKSTRKGDKEKLMDCLETINVGKELDDTQKGFLESLYDEEKERQRRYNTNYRLRKLNKQ